jgi:4-alpha-glucanotransferase
MKYRRSSGILLHPTSLPGPHGIGDIGPRAYAWVDFLAETGCSLWQVLPLGPTGYGDSPYQCFSAFAGNPYLISLEALVKDGLLQDADLADLPDFSPDAVDYGRLIPWKQSMLDLAYQRFVASKRRRWRQDFDLFRHEHSAWLEDFALFMALKEAHQGAAWKSWDASLRDRQPQALAEARIRHAEAIERHAFRQFIFFRQWDALHKHARKRNIQIIGDIPIFVAHDSSDVWANPELFFLDAKGRPTVVAGVPPDYYSATGQLWGNPLYRWEVHRASGYAWWLERIRAVLRQVDIVRIDHFRGFCAYWEVPGRARTARNGHWVPAPGTDFFRTIQSSLGDLPIIAEDLGVITPDVDELRDAFGLPGMKVLLFGFGVGFGGGPDGPFLPHNYPVHAVAYTGTHDNDTVRGWYERVGAEEADFYRRYLARDGHDVSWDFIRAIWGSVAVFALAPMQDLLSLGNEARMNYPGNPSGNWTWRFREQALDMMLRARLREMNHLYYRQNSR